MRKISSCRLVSVLLVAGFAVGGAGGQEVSSRSQDSSSSQKVAAPGATAPASDATNSSVEALPQAPTVQLPVGNISGSVLDPTGAIIAGARVTLTPASGAPAETHPVETLSGNDGRFRFGGVAVGVFHVTAMWPGFTAQSASGELHAEENLELPAITLPMTAATSAVEVTVSQQELAQYEIQAEEKQRVLGFLPNFYITYAPHPVPLSTKQKFELAWKTTLDPVTFAVTGIIAGYEMGSDDFNGYGQGAAGYGKRYAAVYGDGLTSTMIGGAILPSLLKQDPRYYYKGTGSIRSRALYAIAMAVICKGDNGHWQFNYSAVGGELISGAISNLYYPSANRSGTGLTFQNAALGTAASAIANLFQEFLIKKLTPKVPDYSASPAQQTPNRAPKP
jgi:hypothetical protein